MIEQMFCDDEERQAFRSGTPEFDAQVKVLESSFGPLNTASWYSVSTGQYNAIYDDTIVSVVFSANPPYLEVGNIGATGRKYFMDKGWIYDKVYAFLSPGSSPLPLPPGGKAMYLGKLVNVYGQPGDEDLTRYECLYFMHPDHNVVESWAGQAFPQGAYSTFYAATYDTKDGNRLLRMKTYVYNDQNEFFSDWDMIYIRDCKRFGVLDEIK